MVGNAESAAGLEMTLLGATFVYPEGVVFALTGTDFGATLDGKPVELWTSFEARPGQALRLGPTRSGARCYLCVRGGIAVTPFLGSASTHLLSGLGGHEGRALRKGDVLRIGDAGGLYRKRTLAAKALERLAPRKILRVTPGPQSEWFSEAAQKLFYGSTFRVAEESNRMGLRLEGAAIQEGAHGEMMSTFRVAEESNRMGLRLEGAAIQEGAHGEMITEGVSLGAVQIPAGGLPIILFVEQQTTGGYAKIANVISADFHSLGQLRPRDEIRFERVDFETARALLVENEKLLGSESLMVES